MASPTPIWGIHKYDTTNAAAPLENLFNTHADDLETALNSLLANNGYPRYATLTLLTAAPGSAARQHATVYADPTTANNGDYYWNGTLWVLVVGDTGWITPTLSTGWSVPLGETPQYRRLNGVVYSRGRATSTGAVAAAFTLPAGFRPISAVVWWGNNGAATLVQASVATTGGVGTNSAVAATNFSFSSMPPFPADA